VSDGSTGRSGAEARGPAWSSPEALCLGMDTEIFYNLGNREDVSYAVKTCGLCTVSQDCLEAALLEERGLPGYGIRAGLLPAERKALARRRRRAMAAQRPALAS
jgi:hypothetical protein